ncbi:hypothetical protein T3H97_16430 [Paenibacillus sp. LX16]|uniref:hypothetical protein n=1 Tax=Paenibacillus sp. LX16 TaxID=1740264 RepID=UPI002E2C1A95|nr:hypothetical protein [Paenibacillus sp. LX16]
MTDKPRLIDADKLGRFLEEEIGGLAAKRIEITIAAGLFDPDPPQQPDIKLWSKVKHKHHPSWGIGIFQEFSKKKDKALILWPDRKGMFGDRVIGYCQVEKLQKVEGEES